MPLIQKKVVFYLDHESISMRFYRTQLPNGHTFFTLKVDLGADDHFILDHRSLPVLRKKMKSILPAALLSRCQIMDENLKINL